MANLIFKFNWDHRPFPYNTGQGKRQFTLPFASGIPNLTPNISQVRGAGTAAAANLGAEGNNVPVAKDTFKAAHSNPVDIYWSGTGANPPPPPFTDLNEVPIGTRVLLARTIGEIANRPTGLRANLFYLETKGTFSAAAGKLQVAYSYGGLSDFAIRTAGSDNNYTPWRYGVTAPTSVSLGSAASYNVGLNSGELMTVGAFGLGAISPDFGRLPINVGEYSNGQTIRCTGGDATGHGSGVGDIVGVPSGTYGAHYMSVGVANAHVMLYPMNVRHSLYHGNMALNSGSITTKRYFKILDESNTQTDSNGFIKAASPVVNLYADRIEPNGEAEEQEIKFFRNDVGCYLLQGSTGFAEQGWYIEVPKDAKGNILVSVEYETLENGDISIKTYKKKFDFESASIVSDLDNPMDIPESRFISIRLNSLPEPELEPDEQFPQTPIEFQPTNLAKAVADALAGAEPPEINEEPLNESL
ncbi:phage tail protein [Acinetobacter baumannii]|nr:phage tail protein [Acinetobacter baumannii]MDC4887225.1 phage tail protein [Acinetobacter baumannii]MDC4927155.1 phage tail protein [Acinetobacter baumannii]MDC4941512.1 phage tail protein [Acinetobacter baumannii]